MLDIIRGLMLLYVIVGLGYFVFHVIRVQRHDRKWNRAPLGPHRWEWPVFLFATVVLWPYAIYLYVYGRPEREVG